MVLAAAGTSPGRLVETDADDNIIGQHPEDPASNVNILADNFNPHGLTIDWAKNVILTSDYIVPLSILKPSLGIIRDNTLRLWDLTTRSIISTITIPDVSSLQERAHFFYLKNQSLLKIFRVLMICAIIRAVGFRT